MIKQISGQKLKEYIDNREKLLIIEALPEKYYSEAHIPGAIQIDYTELELKADKLPEEKNKMIVVYCAGKECQNSIITARQLDSLGYTNVYEYERGKQDWVEAGYPIENTIK